jgi:hypothetical protein
MSWNPYSAPEITGNGLYAHKLTEGTYSFTLLDVTSKTIRPFVPLTTFTSGIAQHVRDFGPAKIFWVGTVGISYGGDNVGWTYTSGGAVVFGLGKGRSIMPNVRVLKSSVSAFQCVAGVLFGWGK